MKDKSRELIQKVFITLISMKVTVTCLALLGILTWAGTHYQVEHGLFEAKKKVFDSWFCMLPVPVLPFEIPFVGAQTVMVIFLLNLTLSLIFLLMIKVYRVGILSIHLGLIILLAGGAVIQKTKVESNLGLLENESSNVTAAYSSWELSFWKDSTNVVKQVHALSDSAFADGAKLKVDPFGISVDIETYHLHCEAELAEQGKPLEGHVNRSNIQTLSELPKEKDPEAHFPGIIATLSREGGEPVGEPVKALFYGLEPEALPVELGGETFMVQLRRTRYPMPLQIQLLDFQREFHPGTRDASSYQSKITIDSGTVKRDVTISMNKPLRYRGWTLYQSSFQELPGGQERSVFAVVKTRGQFIPYVGTAVTSIGLMVHFLTLLIMRTIRQSDPVRRKKAEIGVCNGLALLLYALLGFALVLGLMQPSTTYFALLAACLGGLVASVLSFFSAGAARKA